MTDASYQPEELLITTFARLLLGVESLGHVAVGALSPIPGAAALLAQALAADEGMEEARTGAALAGPGQGQKIRVSIIHGDANNPFTDGGRELFDCAGQGRIDAFFLGGAQIDGGANINLLGTGDYPNLDKRFPGSFGSAFVYFVIPNVILFAPEHTKRVLVDKVDFISAPGTSPPDVHRPGGPKALVTAKCVMAFDAAIKRFVLATVHPGVTVEEVLDNTGFDFDVPEGGPDTVPETPAPDAELLARLRTQIGPEIAKTYPAFAERVFG
ncbi:MAG TPA: CoA-transferase [Rhodospirillales bacterium]|jgi:glutaconate CoA-transferase subunit B|nr:CoA-transferase [Rhodospirillales bacterium]